MSSPNPGQLSPLPPVTTYITGHNPQTGKAIIQSQTPGIWTRFDGDSMAFNVIYTTSEFPPNLNDDADLAAHKATLESGKLGLVNPHGTVCRMVDFAPNNHHLIHRTQSLDYGVVLEGEVEMILDSGDVVALRRGDVAVQRATMHGWRNPSSTEWTRMLFVLQDCQPLRVAGRILGEDLGGAKDVLPSSNS